MIVMIMVIINYGDYVLSNQLDQDPEKIQRMVVE